MLLRPARVICDTNILIFENSLCDSNVEVIDGLDSGIISLCEKHLIE